MRKNKEKIHVIHMLSGLAIGGAEKLLLEFLKSSKSEDKIRYTVLTLKDIIDESMAKELAGIGIELIILKKEDYKNPLSLLKILKVIKEKDIDILHTHEDGGKYWSILCKIAKPELKTVYTSHGNYDIGNLTGIKLLSHKYFVDSTIVISDPINESCEKQGIKKRTVIYNGINLNKFKNDRKLDLNKAKIDIVNVSRITHTIKGQDILIKALYECKEQGIQLHCNFVGGVYDYDMDSMDYLNSLVKELNMENDVSFLGNRNDIPEILAQSDLFILPSRTEAMPLVILEAMAARLPVISSDIAGAKALISHGDSGLLFESDNYLDLAKNIIELYNDRIKMNRIAETGFKYVQNFDISVSVKKYNDVYNKLVKKKLFCS